MKICILIIAVVGVFFSFNIAEPSSSRHTDPEKLYRVLLFKWKKQTTQEQVAAWDSLWQRMAETIDGFDSYEMNRLEPGRYDHAVMMKFASVEAYETYRQHPNHEEINRQGPLLVSDFTEYGYRK